GDAELVQPLPAAAARRSGDADRRQLARPYAGRDRRRDRAPLSADSERIRRVLDVDAAELAPVAGAHDGADPVVRVRRVRVRGSRLGTLDELGTHAASWKRASAVRDPSSAPRKTSRAECTPDSTRAWATSTARTRAIEET